VLNSTSPTLLWDGPWDDFDWGKINGKSDGQDMMRDIPFGFAEYLERPEAPNPQ
jgi:hypothetical protein